jgi:hypothetical protein
MLLTNLGIKRAASKVAALGFALAALAVFAGCGGKGGTGKATVTSVAITPTTATVQINETTEFTAVVNLSDTTTTTSTLVTWEVNGVAGGDANTTGSIVADTADAQIGIYTAPKTVPTTNNGQVSITAVAPQDPSSTTTTTGPTVTSNTATVTIGVGTGLAINPPAATVPAGGSLQFGATLNGLTDPNATWTVTSTNGGSLGTIGAASGLYTAPNFPPPGGTVTITAHDPAAAANATAITNIVYSNKSLNGPFAFSYTGNDSSGFLAAAGSFVADGSGQITNGVEDKESFLTGVSTQVTFSGNYIVGADGRGNATIVTTSGTDTLQFVLTTNQHALLIRFDATYTGAGSLDEQNLNDLGTSPSLVSGPFVFKLTGTDAAFHPEVAGGRFSANGGGGIPQSATVIDVNDNGTVTTPAGGDTSLQGTYAFDTSFPGSARGTMTLTSGTTGSLQFAFYLVDGTHLHMVEIDRNAFLAGEVFTGASGGAFSNANLAPGNYAFTSGGTASGNAYALGGIFISDGGGNVTGGATDKNSGGTVATNAAVGMCPYSVNTTNSRIDLKVFNGSGACPATPAASVFEFAAYPTAQGSALLVELDAAGVSTGSAFFQSATTSPSGSFALLFAGQGAFHNSTASIQQNAVGQVTLSGTSVTSGNLNVNTFNAVFPQPDPISPASSSVAAPATNGRGTIVLVGTDPGVTYNLVYYLINGQNALLLDQDKTLVTLGSLNDQF